MHTRRGGFCTRARQQNVSDDFAGRHIADLIKMFRIQFDRDAGGKLAFYRRDPVELKLEIALRMWTIMPLDCGKSNWDNFDMQSAGSIDE